MEVKWVGAPGYSRETYLSFDLTGVGPDSGISSAKVRLFGRKLDTVVPSMTVGLYAVSSTSWDESTLTWNTRPAAAGSPLATRTIAGSAGAWYEFDITNFLKQQKAAGATSVAFAVRAEAISEGWAGFVSDEAAANRPELVVAQQG
jgi:hyaluronate lyase